jgi:ketosteroid isomerase-like protein
MASPAEIVERNFDAWTSKDFETARNLLHDDLSFTGPFETVDRAGAPLQSQAFFDARPFAPMFEQRGD